jgi:hypothetical protein
MFQGGGVVVDRSPTPNHIYVADTGNSRIMGFYSYESRKADLIFGQPDEFSGAPNGDCNTGVYGSATRASMCLMCTPANPNLGEQWMRLNIDVDAEGNLYVPDFYNNRVLMYRTPFKKNSAGDLTANLPDLVLGQPNFNSNGINRGKGPNDRNKRSLYLSFGGDHVSSRGVSVDSAGDIWVADTFNYRVLRFPKGSTEADLVLGQPNFKDSFPNSDTGRHVVRLDLMYYPVLARVNPETGELYVVDEYPGRFGARILVFEPPFKNGMPAARLVFPRQLPEGDYAQGNYQLTHATGLVFNPVKTDDWIDENTRTHRYSDGLFWLHDSGPDGSGKRTVLLDKEGTILLAIGAPDVVTFGENTKHTAMSISIPKRPST